MLRFTRRTQPAADKQPRMSAMIDIVFLLLIFFVMTFRIVPQEGDFTVDFAPKEQPSASPPTQLPLRLRLIAAESGSLAELRVNGRTLRDREQLRRLLLGMQAEGELEGLTVLLACDYDLAYAEVIKTLDVVTGHRDETGMIRPLATKVKFVDAT